MAKSPLIGVHVSISGGVRNAPLRGHELGCACVQIFTKSNMQWAVRPLEKTDIEEFKSNCAKFEIDPVMAHDSYLINLCATDPALAQKSFESFVVELQRCQQLGIPGLIMHPGSHTGAGEEAGLRNVIKAVNDAIALTSDSSVRVLFEATAGQGSNLGHRFEQLAQLVEGVAHPERVGVCLDTCHIFAAGYDIRTATGYRQVMEEFDKIVGLRHLRAFHFNDAKGELGSRLDRHEHIGQGKLGAEAFSFILRDPRFEDVPKLLETPKGKKGKEDWDAVNLATLRRLASS